MAEAIIINQQSVANWDPARFFVDAEPWSTQWQYRYVPPNQLTRLDVFSDHGLERLLYLQFLISDEVESGEPARR
jgi:hypothetical protein